MKDLKAIRGRNYILGLIEAGEHEHQDFKFAITDARKIARSISAFANRSGGALLIGVKDNGVIAGVRDEGDIYMVEQAAERYCKPSQMVEFQAYKTGDSGIVVRAYVAPATERPVMAQDDDKSWRAYYRVADENIAAHPLMVKMWQRQAMGLAETFNLDGVETQILKHLDSHGPTAFDALYLAITSPRRTIDTAIVRLASLSLIQFVHHSPHWLLSLPDL